MRSGVRIGVDVGSVRVGVAASDPSGLLASPVTALRRDPRGDTDLAALAELVRERSAVEVVVGLPRSLSGAAGAAERAARDYAVRVAAHVDPVPVRLVDERLSTVAAARSMSSAGRSAREQRSRVDAAAAAVILQTALDAERAGGLSGELVAPGSSA